jgi:glycerol uptake facilitator-like aquaporin
VTRYEWLLLLHLIGAFALVGAAVVGTVAILSMRSGNRAALVLTPLGQRFGDVGGMLALIFGVWLAIDLDQYDLFDGWIIAALVLWVIVAATGAQLGMALAKARDEGAELPNILVPYVITTLATILLLVDMIVKPGA